MGLFDSLIQQVVKFIISNPIASLLLVTIIFVAFWIYDKLKPRGKNPFSVDSIRPREPLETDLKKRDAVLKQGFTTKKIPVNLDVIVIGSGIGGLSCAALLAKTGRKVLVLEQHDQAGGCCHTFIEKGFEFDVGIHYIGEVCGNTLTQTFVEQISEGQIGWEPVNDIIDRLELGTGSDRTTHNVCKGRDEWKAELKKSFPSQKDHKAIDQFFQDLKTIRKAYPHSFILKLLPMWLVRFVIHSGIFSRFSQLDRFCKMSCREYLDSLTDNKRLHAALSYSFGDYGTQPREAPAMMQLMLLQHYTHGGYYPIGGASEIAFHIIPVIEKFGGKVLVRAPVEEIIIDDSGKATGVMVKKGGEEISIHAPLIVSAAGYLNTYNSMIKNPKAQRPEVMSLLSKVKSGHGAISIFVGLEGSKEELGLESINTWAMSDVDLDKGLDDYLATPKEEIGKGEIPLLFISFPSTKDPTWDSRFPGKSNCTIITLAKWEWFEQWENERIMKRGESYDDLKTLLAEKAWQQTCEFYPQLKDKRVYFEVGTPLTNKYYLGSPHGEIYGLDHDLSRFNPLISAQLRPVSPISGLYLTGQDISTGGFAGGLYGGLLTSVAILNRNLMADLVGCTKQMRKLAKKQK